MKLADYGYRVCVRYRTGSGKPHREYLKHGLRHRDDGPALIYLDGSYYEYCKNGKLHRLDGPARVWRNPDILNEYFIGGHVFTRLEYLKMGLTDINEI